MSLISDTDADTDADAVVDASAKSWRCIDDDEERR